MLTIKRAVSALAVGAVLVAIGWHAHDWYHKHYDRHKHRNVKVSGFKYTSPLLDVELPEGIRINHEPIPFKYKLKDYVRIQQERGRANRISIYYRDLLDGPWFGINEKEEFNPASMMKVPVMIAWLKRAETDPSVLKKTFIHDGREDKNRFEFFKPREAVVAGKPYAVEELLRYMMSFSDNNATALLYENLKDEEINEVLDGMDVANHPNESINSISVHGYSGFFRILYNASYLERRMSEKALQLLSIPGFPAGMVAGVPPGTVVASKFGEDESGPGGRVKQLHEFGIVYHPRGNYILGIMTQGSDFTELAGIIREISSIVYSEVQNVPVLEDHR